MLATLSAFTPIGAIDPPFCDIKKFIGPQLRSSSFHVKLSECFKVPSDLTTTSRVLHPCHEHDSDDEHDPYAPPYPPPSLPDIRDAISASAQPLSNTPRCVTPPAPVCPADHSLDDAAAPPSCTEDPPVEKAVTSAHPPCFHPVYGDHRAPDVLLRVSGIMILICDFCSFVVVFGLL